MAEIGHARTRCFPSCRAPCSPTCGASAPAQLLELDADGYAIGGLSVGEPRPLSLEMVEATEPMLPRDRPRYAMGVGMPEELPEYVARGIDMMDCVLPSRNARNGYLFTSAGRVIIKHARYKDDARPARRELSAATPAAAIPAPTFAICFRPVRFCMRYWRLVTTSSRTLTSCGEIRHAILLGTFPEYLKCVVAGGR